tara:strand:+ start:591 stop:773 length:183 start_codon:yes stop_codon:yes gene_type:complete
MDSFIYMVGNNTCKILGDIGLNKLQSILDCNNSDNYFIGLNTLFIIGIIIFSLGYSTSKK